MDCCSFSINVCASSSSFCCIIVASFPSLMIICSLFSRLCTLYYSSFCSANASWTYMGDLICHLFGTYLLRSFFNCRFWKVFLLVLQQCSKDWIVISGRSKPSVGIWPFMGFLISGEISVCVIDLVDGMVRNVNVNVDLCFGISCELVMWLTIAKYQSLEIIYRAGGRWRVKWKLGRFTNQRWDARVRTHEKNVLPQ